ncbi:MULTISPECIES: hypothetical protein [unclassified Lentimonas]|uniref:hypothetical protein n=1 Tax=unclassified Lentimonas TaxID=2630993 RepID=UPI00132371B2|nr:MULTISPECIES: hypothetical protein [unclassified Lentimonas]CAA6676549.1 Unannotated [Lentimonas sp. CC4]CAA6685389.1 Unannotated [Lentimonas sp. CC6]CAA7074887.1 Unannotated [Lentimonas sp. CC4]CAA7169512.1 Unannotated [Lentimonas sp. CC21]CAA7182727.1 Unannotated [Lentimonas sp. CC8]
MKPTQIRFLIFACLVILSIGLVFNHPWLFKLIIGPFYFGDPLFLDMHGQLASAQAWSEGFDVLNNPNPLDILHRRHIGPTWMLLMGHLGLGVRHTGILAVTSILGVIAIGLALFNPKNWREVFLGWLALSSPSVLFGFERANIDITLFCVLCLAAFIAAQATEGEKTKGWMGWLAWSIIAINIGFKYFPAAAFVVLAHERWGWRRFAQFTLAGSIACAVYAMTHWQEIQWVKGQVSSEPAHLQFGGSMFLQLIGVHENKVFLLCVGLVGLILLIGAMLAARSRIRLPHSTEWPGTFFLLSASTVIFCFTTSSNFEYRLVFLLPAFPLLIRTLSDKKHPTYIRIPYILTLCLLYFQMWSDAAYFFTTYDPETARWNEQLSTEFLLLKNSLSWVLIILLAWIMTFVLYPRLDGLFKSWKSEHRLKLKNKHATPGQNL